MSNVKKLLAALGIGATATASEETEAGLPFFHASRKLFDKPKAHGTEMEFGDTFGPGFYGLATPNRAYYNSLLSADADQYSMDALEEAIKRTGREESVYDLADLIYKPELGDRMKGIEVPNQDFIQANPDYQDVATELEQIIKQKPWKNTTQFYEYDFDTDLEDLLDFNANPTDHRILGDILQADVEDVYDMGQLLGTAHNQFGPEGLINRLLLGGYRGIRHEDDMTGLEAYTSFKPGLDLRLINRE